VAETIYYNSITLLKNIKYSNFPVVRKYLRFSEEIRLERGMHKSLNKRRGVMERMAPADATIDVRNNSHPLSILKTQWSLKQLNEGKILEVLCGDEETKEDLLRIIQKSPHQKVIGILWEEGNCCRILISRLKKA
jgi:TusA-related sulfurtransferase